MSCATSSRPNRVGSTFAAAFRAGIYVDYKANGPDTDESRGHLDLVKEVLDAHIVHLI